jgi:hypothetical protein
MLMSSECCGVPIFASSLKAKCRQCEKEHTLRINPRIVSFLPCLSEDRVFCKVLQCVCSPTS